jgi:hypothetical protein
MPRTITPERMDDPQASRDELGQSLAFLRKLNRHLGGVGPALRILESVARDAPRGGPLRVLDVGTGAADIPLAMVRWAEPRGLDLHVTAVDAHATTLALARALLGPQDRIELVRADALELERAYAAGSFDVVHASLFLHHLPDVQVLAVLRAMCRLARRRIIWNDLRRGWIGRIGVRLATLGAPPIVRHDGIASVAAGFTRREALDLARRAGLAAVEFRPVLGYRFVLTGAAAPQG